MERSGLKSVDGSDNIKRGTIYVNITQERLVIESLPGLCLRTYPACHHMADMMKIYCEFLYLWTNDRPRKCIKFNVHVFEKHFIRIPCKSADSDKNSSKKSKYTKEKYKYTNKSP